MRGIELSSEFEVTGLFYEAGGYKLRKYLDIQRASTLKVTPDLMVVMMNPGSSYPLDGIENNSLPSKAEPDTTQKQIMKVMNGASFDFARILNLSDIRTSNSIELYKFVKSDHSKLVDHSIFSASRIVDLNNLFVKNVPVIFGWGVNSALIPLAKMAMESLCIQDPRGILKAKTKYSYYHPLPKIYEERLEWVEEVIGQFM